MSYNRHLGGQKAARTRRINKIVRMLGADMLPKNEQPTIINGEVQYLPQKTNWKQKAEDEYRRNKIRRSSMDKIVVSNRKGIFQDVRLLSLGYGDEFDLRHRQPVVYVAGMDYQWFEYMPLEDMTVYMFWRDNLTGVDFRTLAEIAYDLVHGKNILKGWAAMILLTEDVTIMTDEELQNAIVAANRHTGLMKHNALAILQPELDDREIGKVE